MKIVGLSDWDNVNKSLCLIFTEPVQSWDKLAQKLIPTNSVYEKQDRNLSPSGNEADASLAMRSLDENNVMDTSKLKEEEGDHEEEREEEEEEPKPTYDAEEYDDEDKHENTEDDEEVDDEEQEEEEVVEVKEEDPSDTDNGAMKKERSPAETSSVSNITETANDSRDEDYLEDSPTNQYDNTYYYYDEYENGNRSRYDAGGFVFPLT